MLLLPCLCACLSVPVQKQEGQRVLEEQEEAKQEEVALPESQVKRRSLPALTEPFTTTLAELLRPGGVPAEVQDQLAASLLGLPAQLQKEWDGFHYWLPRCRHPAVQSPPSGSRRTPSADGWTARGKALI